jgi:hypothetical protein
MTHFHTYSTDKPNFITVNCVDIRNVFVISMGIVVFCLAMRWDQSLRSEINDMCKASGIPSVASTVHMKKDLPDMPLTRVKMSTSLLSKSRGKFLNHGIVVTRVVTSDVPNLQTFSIEQYEEKTYIPCEQYATAHISCTKLDPAAFHCELYSFGWIQTARARATTFPMVCLQSSDRWQQNNRHYLRPAMHRMWDWLRRLQSCSGVNTVSK